MSSSTSEEQEVGTFTKWVNLHLKKRDMEVENIFTDFRDGVKLINLYEQISQYEFPKYNKKPMVKVQSIENLRQVLLKIQEFMDSAGLKLQYGAEQLYDSGNGESDHVQILGLLWVLISKFVIAAGADEDEEQKSLKQELLQWCQENTAEYDNVNLKNFTTDWQNGLGFCALIHHFLPEKLPQYHDLKEDDHLENIKLATKTAEEIGIDNVLDEEELASAEHVNERSIMTQVAMYRKHLKPYADNMKAQKLEKQMKDYEYNAEDLVKSLHKQIIDFNDKKFDNASNKECCEAETQLKDYKNAHRQSLTCQKTALEHDFIQMRRDRSSANVPEYSASNVDFTPNSVRDLFKELSEAESNMQDRIDERKRALRDDVKEFDSSASEYIREAEDQALNNGTDEEQGEEAVKQMEDRADSLLEKFDSLREDDLAKFSTNSHERIIQARDMVRFAITGETSTPLKSVLTSVEESRKQKKQMEDDGDGNSGNTIY